MQKVLVILSIVLLFSGCLSGGEDVKGDLVVDSLVEPEKNDSLNLQVIERKTTVFRNRNLSREKFISDLGVEPVVGMVVQAPQENTTFVSWPIEVMDVVGDVVFIRYSPDNSSSFSTIFGPAELKVDEEIIQVIVPAVKGQVVVVDGKKVSVLDVRQDEILINVELAD